MLPWDSGRDMSPRPVLRVLPMPAGGRGRGTEEVRARVEGGPGAGAGQALGWLGGRSADGGRSPMQRGNSKAAGKPDSRVRDLLGTWEGELAGQALGREWGGGCPCSQLGPAKGPSHWAPQVPSRVSSPDWPAGGAQHLPSAGAGTWQEQLRTRGLLSRKGLTLSTAAPRPKSRGLWAPIQCVLPGPKPALGLRALRSEECG